MISLEDIVKTYGMNDYLDINTGIIYKLSKAVDLGNGEYKVPIITFNGIFVGYVSMSKEDINV